MNSVYEKLLKDKYILFFKTINIYQFETFNNRLKLNNFIKKNNLDIYFVFIKDKDVSKTLDNIIKPYLDYMDKEYLHNEK